MAFMLVFLRGPRNRAMSPSEGSVSHWLRPLQEGDPDAVQPLWSATSSGGRAGPQEAAQPAASRGGRERGPTRLRQLLSRRRARPVPQLVDRDSLWRLLVVITARKVVHYKRDANRQKRGGGPPYSGRPRGMPTWRQQLWQSLLDRAQAERLSYRVGQRFASLEAIQQAAALRHELGTPPAGPSTRCATRR